MSVSLSKGLLIAIEGIDGSGKSTQARRLVANLVRRGYSVVLSREPTGGPCGTRILEASASERSLSPQEEVDLFIADRKAHIEELIAPALEEKLVVVLDRYYYSSVAYQGVLEGMTPEKVLEANEAFALKPDLWLILDVDPAVGLGRIAKRGKGTTSFEASGYLDRVRAVFRSLTGANAIHFDASASQDELAGRLEAAVVDICERYSNPSE